MLIRIIRQIQNLKRTYGKRPNVLYLSSDHCRVLRERYPEIFTDAGEIDDSSPLGLKAVIVPKDYLQYPRVACVFPGMSHIYHRAGRVGSDRCYGDPVALG